MKPAGTVTRPRTHTPSLATLLDNARTAIAAGHDAGLETTVLFVSEADFCEVRRTKRREVAHAFPIRLLGVEIRSRRGLDEGTVLLASASELADRSGGSDGEAG